MTPLEHAIVTQKRLAVVRELFAFGPDIFTRARIILTVTVQNEDIDIIYEVIHQIDADSLIEYFADAEFTISTDNLLYLINNSSYYIAYHFFLNRLNPIWEKEMWPLIY